MWVPLALKTFWLVLWRLFFLNFIIFYIFNTTLTFSSPFIFMLFLDLYLWTFIQFKFLLSPNRQTVLCCASGVQGYRLVYPFGTSKSDKYGGVFTKLFANPCRYMWCVCLNLWHTILVTVSHTNVTHHVLSAHLSVRS